MENAYRLEKQYKLGQKAKQSPKKAIIMRISPTNQLPTIDTAENLQERGSQTAQSMRRYFQQRQTMNKTMINNYNVEIPTIENRPKSKVNYRAHSVLSQFQTKTPKTTFLSKIESMSS